MLLTLCLAACMSGALKDEGTPVRVMSFNVRYANPGDGADRWEFRRHLVAGTIDAHRPDVVGLQELLTPQLEDLWRALPRYASVGEARDGGVAGERSTILYDAERFELLRHDTFWLSRTPDVPSNDWGAGLRRICTWVELHERASRRTFFVFNTHFDHRSWESRIQSALLVLRKIHAIAGGAPVVLLGDFNSVEWEPAIQILTRGPGRYEGAEDATPPVRDALVFAREPALGPSGTFTGFGDPRPAGPRIDFVFVQGDVEVVRHVVVSDHQDGRVPSDHRPVVADLLVGAPFRDARRQHPLAWKLMLDPDDTGFARGFARPGFDDSHWYVARAGESWERQGHPGFDGVGWYRKWIHVPESWRDELVRLETGGVDDAYTLYIDGDQVARVGSAEDSHWWQRDVLHLPQHALRYGRDNLFVFRVEDAAGEGGLIGSPLRLGIDLDDSTVAADAFTERALESGVELRFASDDERRVRLPVTVPGEVAARSWLCFGVTNGADDTGDFGVVWRLFDARAQVVREGLARDSGTVWVEHPVEARSKWTIELEDLDTELTGQAPGNEATLDVLLREEVPARERSPRSEPPRRPRKAPSAAVAFGKSWYWFPEEPMSFADARALAEEHGGKLVTISSRPENDFVLDNLRGVTFLGLERDGDEWRPLDDDAPFFYLWDFGEPNNGPREQHAGIFPVNGRWHDYLDHEAHFACVEWGDER